MSDDNDKTQHDWEGVWQKPEKPLFDAGQSAQALANLLEQRPYPAGAKALIPGCGRGYDVVAFVKAGLDATGVDISPTGVQHATEYLQSEGIAPSQGRVLVVDFFKPPKEMHGMYDVIYDYTFLCAIPPGMRTEWAETMNALLKPDGELITLIFPTDAITEYGPPFRLTVEMVTNLLVPKGFHTIYCEPVPTRLSHPRRAGREVLARWRRN
jgi:cyclopropane fatty-acyl-phospholipid synthase-like methyltransferase